MRGTADGALHFVRAFGHASEDAAEETSGDARRGSEDAHRRVFETRHVAVVALLAEELELITAIGGQVFVISGEADGNHGFSWGVGSGGWGVGEEARATTRDRSPAFRASPPTPHPYSPHPPFPSVY